MERVSTRPNAPPVADLKVVVMVVVGGGERSWLQTEMYISICRRHNDSTYNMGMGTIQWRGCLSPRELSIEAMVCGLTTKPERAVNTRETR